MCVLFFSLILHLFVVINNYFANVYLKSRPSLPQGKKWRQIIEKASPRVNLFNFALRFPFPM